MTPFDVVVLLLLAMALAIGASLGLVRAALSLVGLGLGVVGAFTFTKRLMLSQRPDAVVVRNWIFLAGFIGLPLLGWVLAGAAARALRSPEGGELSAFERVTGAVVAGVAMVALVWFVVPASRTSTVVAAWTASSETSHVLESFPPPPVDVGVLIGQDRFPANLANLLGVEDVSNPPRDLPAVPPAALQRAEQASVQVVAESCGAFNWGSGFAVRPDLVATNAHVVAGSNGGVRVISHHRTADATVVTFDPARDFALLALSSSTLPALRLETRAVNPQAVVVTLGHPGGQESLDVGPARVVDQKFVDMTDPYGRPVNRATMLLSTGDHVRPGSSGGAVIDTSGNVVGAVFAGPRSGTGFALAIPSEEIVDDVTQVTMQPVSAGGCDGLHG